MGRSLSEQYAVLFGRPWSIWGSAVLVATVNVFLFAFDRPWTASDGMRNWGDWALTGLGVARRPDLLAPWLYSGSLLNAGVLLGGLVAALLAREFAVRVPPRGELLKGGCGGLLMGVGAVLAFGCNIGGFFSATSALSLAGLGMMLGLGAGASLGLRYLVWETGHRPEGSGGTGAGCRAASGAGAGALGGGLVFGVGMTLAGGCGAGSIWRAGEGQVKLWAAIACFALGGSLARLVAAQTGLLRELGAAVFLPSAIGWGPALGLVVLVMAAWALGATWNEEHRRFSAL